jgi:hypothetical protein
MKSKLFVALLAVAFSTAMVVGAEAGKKSSKKPSGANGHGIALITVDVGGYADKTYAESGASVEAASESTGKNGGKATANTSSGGSFNASSATTSKGHKRGSTDFQTGGTFNAGTSTSAN